MRKLGIVLVAIAVGLLGPRMWAEGDESTPCPHKVEPMSQALHAVISKAEKAAEAKDFLGAAQIVEVYLKNHTQESHPYPYYEAGYFFHKAGKRDAAIGHLKKALKLNPCFQEAWQLLAVLHQESKQYKEAAVALQKAAAVTASPRTWYQAAMLWLDAGSPGKALAILKRLNSGQKKEADWYVAMARAHQMLKQNARAAKAFESAYALSKDPEHLYQCAVFWLEAGDSAKALPPLRQLSKRSDPKSHWLVALSNALKAQKKKEDTAEAMERAAAISGDPKLYYHAAYLWLEANRPKKALKLLEQLAKRKRPKAEWLLALANTYVMLDQIKSAAVTMDRVVRLAPKPDYLYNAGVLWLQAERPRKALSHLLPLCENTPAKAEWFVALAHAWLGKKEIVKAARAMERAAVLCGKPEYAYQAGLLWLQAKEADGALRLLKPLSKQPNPKYEWFVALSNAWVLKENYGNAASAMERAAGISGKPGHFYAAASLWLQAEAPRKALPLLLDLAKRNKPEAKWLVLLSETWLRLKDVFQAAEAMERAASISHRNDHVFRAARLWMEADQPARALPFLERLVRAPSPSGEWFITLSNCYLMLDQPEKAARAMEGGAEITRKGEDYYRAGMLWLQVENSAKGISLLRKCTARKPVKQKWLLSLAQALIDSQRDRDALAVMEKTVLTNSKISPEVRYRGAVLWLHLQRPQKAVPVLKMLCSSKNPALDWLVSLVKTYVELEQVAMADKSLDRLILLYPENASAWRLAVWMGLQQADYARAAAAMAVAVRLEPPDADQMKELADLYHMAGVPTKAAAAMRKTWKETPTAEDWDRLVNIYLTAHRNEMALASAKSALKVEETAERWATVGAIAFRLRRFEESYDAYRHGAQLTPDADIRLKAGYAALKMDNLDEAARLFREAMKGARKNSRTAHEAHRNLVYIKKMRAFLEKSG